MIEMKNHGALIIRSNYWRSEYAREGKLLLSPNAGVLRCLIPASLQGVLGELRAAEYALVSRGPIDHAAARAIGWHVRPDQTEGVEILWEDHTSSPHVWHLTPESCLLVPGDPGESQWIVACWVERRGAPHKALERAAHWHWRRVPSFGA